MIASGPALTSGYGTVLTRMVPTVVQPPIRALTVYGVDEWVITNGFCTKARCSVSVSAPLGQAQRSRKDELHNDQPRAGI